MPLYMEFVDLERAPDFDDPDKGLYGVEILIYLFGDPGRIKVAWGTYETEYFDVADWGLAMGGNKIANSIPPGTHNICVDVV